MAILGTTKGSDAIIGAPRQLGVKDLALGFLLGGPRGAASVYVQDQLNNSPQNQQRRQVYADLQRVLTPAGEQVSEGTMGPGVDGAPMGRTIPPEDRFAAMPSVAKAAPVLARAMMSGLDVGPAMQLLEKAGPDIQFVNGQAVDKRRAKAGERYGVNLSPVNDWMVDTQDPGNANRFMPKAPTEGAVPLFDADGKPVAWKMADGALEVIGQSARARTSGESAGRAPYELVDIPSGDGSTSRMPKSAFLNTYGGSGYSASRGQGPDASPGAPAFGRTPSAAEASYMADAGRRASDLLATASDDLSTANTKARSARDGLNLATTLDPTKATPLKRATVELARATGLSSPELDRFAGDTKSYEALTNQLLIQNAKALGANPSNRDAEIMKSVYPSLSSPQQSAVVFFAASEAMANRDGAYARFRSQYQGPKDPQEINRQWLASKEAQRSIFQDPVYQNLAVDGRPLVVRTPKPASDGYYWGQVNVPGAKPYRFRIIP